MQQQQEMEEVGEIAPGEPALDQEAERRKNHITYMIRLLRDKQANILFCYDQRDKILWLETENGPMASHHAADYRGVVNPDRHKHLFIHSIISERLMERRLVPKQSLYDVCCNVWPRDLLDENFHTSVTTELVVGGMSREVGYELVVALQGAFMNAINGMVSPLLPPDDDNDNDNLSASSLHLFLVICDPICIAEIQDMHIYTKRVLQQLQKREYVKQVRVRGKRS